MYELYKRENSDHSVQIDSFGPRYAQLVRAGLLEEMDEHQCEFTNQHVTTWDVTTLIPRVGLTSSGSSGPNTKAWMRQRIKSLECLLMEANKSLEMLRACSPQEKNGQRRLF
jgi:hypothetical protein